MASQVVSVASGPSQESLAFASRRRHSRNLVVVVVCKAIRRHHGVRFHAQPLNFAAPGCHGLSVQRVGPDLATLPLLAAGGVSVREIRRHCSGCSLLPCFAVVTMPREKSPSPSRNPLSVRVYFYYLPSIDRAYALSINAQTDELVVALTPSAAGTDQAMTRLHPI